MAVIIETRLNASLEGGFASETYEADESAKRYVIRGLRSVVSKASMMTPDSVSLPHVTPVTGRIWHLPEQENEAKALLIAHCRQRIATARETAASITRMADNGEKFLNALETPGQE